MRKRWLVIMLAALCLWAGAACADWTCPAVALDGTPCGYVNKDGNLYCDWCGTDEPFHDLRVEMTGVNFLRLSWYGAMKTNLKGQIHVNLYYCPAGSGAWQVTEDISENSCLLRELDSGVTYDIMLISSTGAQLAIQAATVPQVTATAEPTATPVPTAEPKTVSVKVGDIITFGRYPQTSSGTDNTPIEWIVLDMNSKEGWALVTSRFLLDAHQYHDQNDDTSMRWNNCTLRTWLNNDFMNTAFTAQEQAAILTTTVVCDDVDWTTVYKEDGFWTFSGTDENVTCADTRDKLFLLSVEEAGKYFPTPESRICAPTDYAIKRGAWTSSNYTDSTGRDAGYWWLRSGVSRSSWAAGVSSGGARSNNFGPQNSGGGVRPAFRINLESGIF